MTLLLSLMNPLERFNRLVGWIGSYLSILALALMIFIIRYRFFRYVLNNTLPWLDGARFLILWLTGLMAPVRTIGIANPTLAAMNWKNFM